MAVNTTGRTYRDAGVDLDKAASVKERIKSIAASALGSRSCRRSRVFSAECSTLTRPATCCSYRAPTRWGRRSASPRRSAATTRWATTSSTTASTTSSRRARRRCSSSTTSASASWTRRWSPASSKGLADACSKANCSLLGGETATLAGIYEAGDFDLVGFIVGAVQRDRLLTPDGTRPGDVLLGLPSSGLHTNGYSLVRSVFDIDENPEVLASPIPDDDGRTLGDALLAPHRQYLDELRPVLPRTKGLAHITGGSFYKNVPRSLAPGLAAEIDVSTWTVPPLFRLIESRGVDTGEMFRVFNMGVGMAIIVGADDAESVRQDVPDSWELGRVVEQTGEARVSFVGAGSERLS